MIDVIIEIFELLTDLICEFAEYRYNKRKKERKKL